MRVLILGGPGAGKGTQGHQLCSKLNIPWIASGDILRDAIAQDTELGRQAQSYVEQGELVPDMITIKFIRQRLLQPDVKNGWLLDGYPRTAFQAEELDFLLDELNQKLDWVIWLKVSEDVMMSRCLDRSRSDDELGILQRRIELFQERTIPILEYYEHRHHLLTIDGDRSPEEVQQDIFNKLNL